MNLSNPDFNVAQFQRQDSLTGMGLGLGRLKPELYKQRSLEGEEGSRRGGGCGRLNFILKFDCDLEQLIVKIHKAEDLPAKDFSGTSDPYVKIYLLPDRKTKHQTKVHRKTLNPVFDEVFLFPVAYSELPTRKLHFSVYDFDRFSRHDIIGQVVVDNFLDLTDFPRETKLCREIQYVSSVSQHFCDTFVPVFLNKVIHTEYTKSMYLFCNRASFQVRISKMNLLVGALSLSLNVLWQQRDYLISVTCSDACNILPASLLTTVHFRHL